MTSSKNLIPEIILVKDPDIKERNDKMKQLGTINEEEDVVIFPEIKFQEAPKRISKKNIIKLRSDLYKRRRTIRRVQPKSRTAKEFFNRYVEKNYYNLVEKPKKQKATPVKKNP
jgi:hypothetical protein